MPRVPFSTSPYVDTFAATSQMMVYPFEDQDTQRIYCWYPARYAALDFIKASNIAGDQKLFNGARPLVTMYCPIDRKEYVSRSVRLKGAATVARVLQALQTFIEEALEFYHDQDKSVKPRFESFVTCHLVISRTGGHNKVYVRTPA